MMQKDAAVSRMTSRIAAVIAASLALGMPLGYFVVVCERETAVLEAKGVGYATQVSSMINAAPETWQLRTDRLETVITRASGLSSGERRRISDLAGKMLAAAPDAPTGPLLVRRVPLLDSGVTVGWLEIGRPLLPIWLRTGLVGLLGVAVAAGVFVTLRVLPLRALARSEDRFQAVAGSTSDAIVLADGAGRIDSWNRAAQILFHRQEAEVLGAPLSIAISDRSKDRFQALLGERLLGIAEPEVGASSVEVLGVRQDGEELPLEISLSRWSASDGVHLSCIMRDVTERHRSQAMLAERLRALEEALAQVKRLQGLVPICAWCKKIRNDRNYWQALDVYVAEHSEAEFSHGICPDCSAKLSQQVRDMAGGPGKE